MNSDLKNLDKRKFFDVVNPNISPCVRLVRNFLEDVGLGKRSISDESSSSYPEDCKSSPSKPLRKEVKSSAKVQMRKTAGKKLRDKNKQFEEDFVWNSSDDEMEGERSSNPLSFTAKNYGDGKVDSKKTPRHDTDNLTQNYVPPPPPGIAEIPPLPLSEKETLKQKKPMLAAQSLSMLTGLITTAKAENVIHQPHVSHRDLPENSDWWGKSSDTKNCQPHVSPIKESKYIEKCLPFGESVGSVDSVTECWLNDQSHVMTSNSNTSTPKGQKKIAESRYTCQSLLDKDAEEFRLRRPSTSLKTSPRPVMVKTEKDANNNFNAIPINYRIARPEGSDGYLDIKGKKQGIIQSPVKLELVALPVKTLFKTESLQNKDDKTDGDSSGVADSGWEEDSGVSDGKDSGKFADNWLETSQEKATFIRGGEVWTETVPKVVTTGKSNHPYKSNVGRGHNAMNDWCETGINSKTGQHYVHSLNKLQEAYSSGDEWCETGSGAKSKQVTSALTGIKGHNPKDDWGSSVTGPSTEISTGKVNIREPNETKLNKPEPDTQSNNPRASTLSPVAKYIKNMSKGGVSKILPPIPAKLVGKIGGKDLGFHFPIGVTTSSKGDVIVADTGNHLVKIFTADSKLKLTIGTMLKPAMQRPSAVVVNERNELFVKDDKCIRMFDLERGAIIRQMGIGQLSQPYGLSMTPDKNLLTLDVDKRNPRIVIFSQEGELVNSFPYTPLQGRIPQTRCRFLDVGKSTLVVSDLGRHEIYVTDLQGRIKSYFGRGGYGNGEFFEPSGVVVDSSGNMIVADSKNDRVQV
ncbi:uncharacterized protein LOC127733727 [Mytilus californianus]|uniref:uncharacterized protein LOC127733727 n=1 Tax=Mytilus californianus TaxID=6549 RepID=UPI002245224A|nr:uncharacterized protein LOC127733727 [Mytilus californianus]